MTNKTKSFFNILIFIFKNHYLACLLAILVGTASIAPLLLAQQAIGEDYQGIPLLFQANEDHYMARIQEIVDGYWFVGSPFLYEYKDNLGIVFPIGEFLYALPVLLFGIPVLSVIMAVKFIFPALLFLLVYSLIYILSKRTSSDKITAALGGLIITFGENFVNYKQVLFLLGGHSTDLLLSLWTRPVNPITGALFLFIFLILLCKSINSRKWYYPVASGIVVGLMTGYIFSWLMALAVVGAVIIISATRRHFGLIKKMFFIIFCSILTGLPAWYIWLHSLYASGDGQFEAKQSGLIYTHQPIFNKVVLLQTVFFLPLFLFEWYRSKKNNEKFEEWWWFTAVLVIGNWLVFNQQIITGRTVWPAHLTQYTIILAFLTFVLVLGNYIKARIPKLWSAAIIVIGGVIILYMGMVTFNYRNADASMKELIALQRFTLIFDWLNDKAPKDCVVFAMENTEYTEPLGDWIPAFTHCNTYLTTNALMPIDRKYFSKMIELRFGGVKEQGLEQYLWDHKTDLRYRFFTSWNQWLDPDDSWLAEPIGVLVNKYPDFLKEDFTTALRRYKIDYFVSEGPLSTALSDEFPNARLLEQAGLFYIYQL